MSPRASRQAHAEHPLVRYLPSMPWLLGLLIFVLLLIAQSLIAQQNRVLSLPLDGREAAYRLNGVHAIEQDGQRTFRWTEATAAYLVDLPGSGPVGVTLWLGGPPPGIETILFTIGSDATNTLTVLAAPNPRVYHVLLATPSAASGRLNIRLSSPTAIVPPDPRPVGVRLEGLTLRVPGSGALLPTLPLAFVELLLLALCTLLAQRLRLLPIVQSLLPISTAIGMFLLTWLAPSFTFTYLLRLVLALGPATILVLLLLPIAERRAQALGIDPHFVRAAIALTLLGCLIRLIGALYPLYQAHDLPLNVERLIRTIGGTLISTNRSFEFRSGVTIYPPGPYLALLPALLLGIPPTLLVQGGNAFVDGIAGLAVIALARAAGASERAALFAGLLYAALPVMLTSLYWGHSAQVFGQALMAPLALALLIGIRRPRSPAFAVAGALLALALLSHIGVSILAIAWLGLVWVLLRWRGILSPSNWLRLTIALGIAGLVGLIFVYGPELTLKIQEATKVGERVASERYVSYGLIWRAYQISFYQIGLALLPIGLLLGWRNRTFSAGAGEVGSAWIIAALAFCGVELVTGLQVRYLVFLAPIACIVIALVLEYLAQRGRLGNMVAWAIAVLMVVQGCAAWYNGTFMDVQMSMVPLLR